MKEIDKDRPEQCKGCEHFVSLHCTRREMLKKAGKFVLACATYELVSLLPAFQAEEAYAKPPKIHYKTIRKFKGDCSEPVISSKGIIYVVNDNYLYALNPDGSNKWVFPADGQADVGLFTTTPSVDRRGRVYIGGDDGFIYALDDEGNLAWECEIGGVPTTAATVSADRSSSGVVYVGCDDNCLYAINPNGVILWKFDIGGMATAPPTVAIGGAVYIGSSDCCLYAVNPNGEMLWKVETGGAVDTSPAVGNGGRLYFGSMDNNFYSTYSDGNLRWKNPTNGVVKSPAISSLNPVEAIFIMNKENYLYSIDTLGKIEWSINAETNNCSRPVLTTNGIVLFGSGDGKLFAINTADKKFLLPLGERIDKKKLYSLLEENMEKKYFSFLLGEKIIGAPAIGTENVVVVITNKDYSHVLLINKDIIDDFFRDKTRSIAEQICPYCIYCTDGGCVYSCTHRT